MSDSLQPHGLQHARPPCPSPTPRACSKSCPLSRWCHPTISSSDVPFSSCLQSFPASGSFQMSQFFTSGGQSIGVSASTSVLPKNIQDWFPLGWIGWIFLLSFIQIFTEPGTVLVWGISRWAEETEPQTQSDRRWQSMSNSGSPADNNIWDGEEERTTRGKKQSRKWLYCYVFKVTDLPEKCTHVTQF